MANSAADRLEEIKRNAIVVIDDDQLPRDCLVQAMHGEFPKLKVVGVPAVPDLYLFKETVVEGILLKVKSQSVNLDELARDIKMIGVYSAQAPVIVISPRGDASNIEAATAAGAQALIPTTATFKIVVSVLRLVLDGLTYFPHPCGYEFGLSDRALRVSHDNAATTVVKSLPLPVTRDADFQENFAGKDHTRDFDEAFTARESQVLAALRLGQSNKRIAHSLNLSENTIKIHVRSIMQKLRAANRTEAVILSQSFVRK
jgi:two-component system, NarL family, nitrate/nitrite response regulator NarL